MRLNPAWIFVLVFTVAAVFIYRTIGALPPVIAVHFDLQGTANGFASRDGYRIALLAFLVALPGSVIAAFSLAGRRDPTRLKIPAKDFWLADERRDATLKFMSAHGFRLSSLLVWFVAGIHWLTLDTNRQSPPHLASRSLLIVLGLFFAGIALWIAAFQLRFRRPRLKSDQPFGTSL
jgi:hypothetical protein